MSTRMTTALFGLALMLSACADSPGGPGAQIPAGAQSSLFESTLDIEVGVCAAPLPIGGSVSYHCSDVCDFIAQCEGADGIAELRCVHDCEQAFAGIDGNAAEAVMGCLQVGGCWASEQMEDTDISELPDALPVSTEVPLPSADEEASESDTEFKSTHGVGSTPTQCLDGLVEHWRQHASTSWRMPRCLGAVTRIEACSGGSSVESAATEPVGSEGISVPGSGDREEDWDSEDDASGEEPVPAPAPEPSEFRDDSKGLAQQICNSAVAVWSDALLDRVDACSQRPCAELDACLAATFECSPLALMGPFGASSSGVVLPEEVAVEVSAPPVEMDPPMPGSELPDDGAAEPDEPGDDASDKEPDESE